MAEKDNWRDPAGEDEPCVVVCTALAMASELIKNKNLVTTGKATPGVGHEITSVRLDEGVTIQAQGGNPDKNER